MGVTENVNSTSPTASTTTPTSSSRRHRDSRRNPANSALRQFDLNRSSSSAPSSSPARISCRRSASHSAASISRSTTTTGSVNYEYRQRLLRHLPQHPHLQGQQLDDHQEDQDPARRAQRQPPQHGAPAHPGRPLLQPEHAKQHRAGGEQQRGCTPGRQGRQHRGEALRGGPRHHPRAQPEPVALTQARLTYNQSIYDYLTNRADFDYTRGRETYLK